MTPNDFRFVEHLRVRWAEVDMQRIVFNAHYLMYIDTAITGYWRALALPYEETLAALGGELYVRNATLDYTGSARFEDRLDIGIRCARIGTSSMVLEGAIFRAGETLVTGELVYVFADPQGQRAQPVPPALRSWLEAYERGESMLDVELGNWTRMGAEAQAIRTRIFVDEQRISAELEWDADDDTAVHALARNRLGVAVGTGRLLQQAPGVARIGRMAVMQVLRGSGVGAAMLQAMMQAARQRGDREVMLHAQVSAIRFYARHGFVARGERFDEAGIAHQEMVACL